MLVTTDNFHDLLAFFKSKDRLVVDLETTGLRPFHGDRMVGIVLCHGTTSAYFAFRHERGGNLPINLLDAVLDVIFDPEKVIIGHNFDFDMRMLYQERPCLPAVIEDTMLLWHLLNENESNFKLKDLGDKYIEEGASDAQTRLEALLKSKGLTGKGDMWKLPPEDVVEYAVQDGLLTWKIREFCQPALDRWGTKYPDFPLVFRHVCLYQKTLTAIALRGMLLDREAIGKAVLELPANMKRIREDLSRQRGYAFNPGSAPQTTEWLGIPNAQAKTLEALDDPRAKAILEYKHYQKADGSFYKPFLREMDQCDVIHPNLLLHGTVTGRCSCVQPNLQAIPRESSGHPIKHVFIPRPGTTLVEVDYKTAEMCIACSYVSWAGGNVDKMVDIIKRGGDMHTETAELLGIPRQVGKTINFGIIYGLGVTGLAKNLGIPNAQSQKYLTLYHGLYPGFQTLYRIMENRAKRDGHIRLYSGRIRHYNTPEAEPRKAMSNLIQGAVAEVMRVKMVQVHRELASEGIRMLLQVHDSLMLEVADGTRLEAMERLQEILESTQFDPPLRIDVKASRTSWGKAQKITSWEQLRTCA